MAGGRAVALYPNISYMFLLNTGVWRSHASKMVVANIGLDYMVGNVSWLYIRRERRRIAEG
jgi:hypothetical protein